MMHLFPFKMVNNWHYVLFLLLFIPLSSFAQQEFEGQWYAVDENWQQAVPATEKIDKPALTGGHFVFQSAFHVDDTTIIVIDFKNASVLGQFKHYIYNPSGQLIATAEGGIQSDAENPFFMRHGREFHLAPGEYRLTTFLSSPFFIAEPAAYWDTLPHYRQAIKPGNALGLVSMGILFSLGVYYAILASVRKRTTEIMYTVFIWMNLIFSGSSMLITPDLFGFHWFYLAGPPILFSNFAYLLFTKSLLQIRADTHPRLHMLAKFALVLLSVFLVVGLLQPHLILECSRYGVGVMMTYSLIAAITRAVEGYKVAYFYLVAIIALFVFGSIAISSSDLEGIYTIYVEHIGLLAVTTEVLLIGLVLGYQFAEIYREKEHNLAMLEHSLKIAHHDSLTGLPNRYALDIALNALDKNDGMLVLLDMDNLKIYNDKFGHPKGDELLKMFASVMPTMLNDHGVLHRMGGDEFAITCEMADCVGQIEVATTETIKYMRTHGFEKAGVSFGVAFMHEVNDSNELVAVADKKMYEHKRQKQIT